MIVCLSVIEGTLILWGNGFCDDSASKYPNLCFDVIDARENLRSEMSLLVSSIICFSWDLLFSEDGWFEVIWHPVLTLCPNNLTGVRKSQTIKDEREGWVWWESGCGNFTIPQQTVGVGLLLNSYQLLLNVSYKLILKSYQLIFNWYQLIQLILNVSS